MNSYTGLRLKSHINISRLYSVHYFEFPKSYKFSGESHNFWEFVYADKDDITVTADSKTFVLKQGNVVFHKPNEHHSISTDITSISSVAVVSFECNSTAMSFFEDKVLPVRQEQKSIVSKIISEYKNAFSSPLDNPNTLFLERKKNASVGSEQLIRQYIAEFLISFLRADSSEIQRSCVNINRDNALFNIIENYMQSRINETITIDDLIKFSGSNKTTITTTFKNTVNMSAIKYFINMKIKFAKKYLREDNYNISQIAEILGYSGIHYFSRQFKQITGMSPKEYSSSIRAMVDDI